MLASTVPTCAAATIRAYVYEIAVIVQDGIRRMYQEGEDRFYYITMYNEDYAMPEMPEGVGEGILRGIYKFKPAPEQARPALQLFGSGPILNEALRAQQILAEKYSVAGRCLERDQLQRTAPRSAGDRALEPAASGGTGEAAVHPAGARRRRRARSSRPPIT